MAIGIEPLTDFIGARNQGVDMGDAVFWDNRSTMHSATPYDMTRHRRVMHRTTIVGDVPF